MYEKINDYILRIFVGEELDINRGDINFNYFIPGAEDKRFGGQICDDYGKLMDTYYIRKDKEKLGFKIDDGKYIYGQQRRRMIDCPEFQNIVSNDEFINEDEFRETFKDVEYVEVFESDKVTGNVLNLSYLVNGHIFLLIKYFTVYERDDTFGASIYPTSLNSQIFKNCGLDEVFDDEQEKKDLRRFLTLNSMYVSDVHQMLFNIISKGEEVNNLNFRVQMVRKFYNDILETEKNTFLLSRDVDVCYESIASNLKKQFGNDVLGER